MGRYSMNLDDGRLVFTTDASRENIRYAEIDDETSDAIANNKLDWHVAANAIRAKRNNDPTFDWKAFDDAREKLNIRKADFGLKEHDDDGKEVNVGKTDDKIKSLNPTVSFAELRKTETRDASTKPNENVAKVDAAPASTTQATKTTRVSSGKVNL